MKLTKILTTLFVIFFVVPNLFAECNWLDDSSISNDCVTFGKVGIGKSPENNVLLHLGGTASRPLILERISIQNVAIETRNSEGSFFLD